MKQEDLEMVMRWLDPAKNPRLVQFTRAAFRAARLLP
jgi:hypothetical protein